jgi:hypothetical protein
MSKPTREARLLKGIALLSALNTAAHERFLADRRQLLLRQKQALEMLEQTSHLHPDVVRSEARRIRSIHERDLDLEASLARTRKQDHRLDVMREMVSERKDQLEAARVEQEAADLVQSLLTIAKLDQPATS